MKKIFLLLTLFLTKASLLGIVENKSKQNDSNLIQVALLLDTSGSMKGLLDQAKCQLWNVVSDLEKAKKSSQPITLQIALYEFGKNKPPYTKENEYLKKVVGFTDNLDHLSSKLFSLHAGYGGKEYYGEVIKAALDNISLGVPVLRSTRLPLWQATNPSIRDLPPFRILPNTSKGNQ